MKLKLNLTLVAALLLAGSVFSFGQEAQLIAVLKSDAPQKEKADACRELARIGTKNAVPALAALLADEKMNHMARYGLETIADPSVDDALRDALGKLKGRPLVGVIGSIGVRRDAKATEALAKLLPDPDALVAQATARALGRIGTSAAAKALTGAMAGAPAGNQLAFCEGLFRCAEALAAKDRRDEAIAIYDRLRNVQAHQVRAGAFRGAVLNRGKDGLPLLVQAIRGDDFAMVEAAIRTSKEMPGADVTQALAGEMGRASGEKQVLLIQTLGLRGDAAAAPALSPLAKSGSVNGRVAAIRALVQLGNPSSVPLIAELVTAAEPEVASAAQTGLAGFPGQEADAAVVSMLRQSDAKTRGIALDLVGQRRIASAMPALLKAAEDADASVSGPSLKVLGDMAGAAELPALLGILMKASAPQAAETALAAVCARQPDAEACADRLLPSLAQAQGAQKIALLSVLRSIGGAKALAAVRAATTDANAEVKDTALRALCDWPTADALADVTQLAKTSADRKFKILALRGCFRLIPLQNAPAEQKFAAIKDAMALAERNEEKKLALAALGGIPTADSLALVAPHLGNPALKEEASMAAVAIAEKIVTSHPAEVAAAMEQVSTANRKLAARAKGLLGQAKRAAPRK